MHWAKPAFQWGLADEFASRMQLSRSVIRARHGEPAPGARAARSPPSFQVHFQAGRGLLHVWTWRAAAMASWKKKSAVAVQFHMIWREQIGAVAAIRSHHGEEAAFDYVVDERLRGGS